MSKLPYTADEKFEEVLPESGLRGLVDFLHEISSRWPFGTDHRLMLFINDYLPKLERLLANESKK
jgi:hypothetical protein